jgi:hypothetical protein
MAEIGRPDVGPEGGITRRGLMKRGALLGGAVVWATPVIQSLTTSAHAQASPLCSACLSATTDPDGPGGNPPTSEHVTFTPTPQCCNCIAGFGGGVVGVLVCAVLTGDCSGVTGPNPGPCTT